MKRTGRVIITALLLLVNSAVWGVTTKYEVTGNTINVRTGPGTQYEVIGKVHKGESVRVIRICDEDWAQIWYYYRTGYISRSYIRQAGKSAKNSQHAFDLFALQFPDEEIYSSWVLLLVFSLVILFLLRKLGVDENWKVTLALWYLFSMPFYVLDLLQFWMAKPWRPLMKKNILSDNAKKAMRIILPILQVPFYFALFPLRFINAVYYNIVIHIFYELSNYIAEVFAPSDPNEGGKGVGRWIAFLPIRILKYLVYHTVLTAIESVLWTIIDTVIPAVTLYHGTERRYAENMISEPQRNKSIKQSSDRKSGTWTVGGGNFAGDGIYFGIFRNTLRNYTRNCINGTAIVARVSIGRTIDTVLMPNNIYQYAGHSNANAVSNWGLRNGYVSGEWWRADGPWWEICMYDRKNKYNASWRIRPIYTFSCSSGIMRRIPGGSAHWLFRKMVFKDMWNSLKGANY